MPAPDLVTFLRIRSTIARMRTVREGSMAVLRAWIDERRGIAQSDKAGCKPARCTISSRELRFHQDRAALALVAEAFARQAQATGDPQALQRMQYNSELIEAMGQYQPVKRAPRKRRKAATKQEPRPELAEAQAGGVAREPAQSPEPSTPENIALPAMSYPKASGPCHRPEADANEMPETGNPAARPEGPPHTARAEGPGSAGDPSSGLKGRFMQCAVNGPFRADQDPAIPRPRLRPGLTEPALSGPHQPARSSFADACQLRSPEVSARLAA